MPEETAVETPPAKAADTAIPPGGKPDAGGEKATPKGSGNKWTDLGVDIAALGKVKDLGELEPDDETPGKKPAPKAKAGGEAEEPEAGAKDKAPEKPAAEKGEEKQPDTAARYSVVSSDGAEFDFEPLPPGAKIAFEVDGKQHEVASVNDLVTLARQGVHVRQVEHTYQRKLAGSNRTITALTTRLKAADQAFREIVEDDEKLEAYRARAKKLTDPEYREGLEAKEKLKAKEAAEEEEGEEVQAQVAQEFWGEARKHFDATLEQYPALDAEDFPDVVRAFWDEGFVAHRTALVQAALDEAGVDELPPAQLEKLDTKALEWLTEQNFDAAIKRVSEKLERRSGRGGGKKPNGRRAATQEEADALEADAHNKHTDDKLRQRDTRTLRGKGAPPGTGGEPPTPRPRTWKDHMSGIHEEFDKAKKPAVAD